MIDCPECKSELFYAVADDRTDKEYRNIHEICMHCGYVKTYVDFIDVETS